MRERYYKLDPNKTTGIKVHPREFSTDKDVPRQRIWQWLRGINGISESDFRRLLAVTGKLPGDLLDDESLKFYANMTINA